MSENETGRLIYLVLMGSVIAAYFLVANRDRIGEVTRQALLWVFIFVGVALTAGFWPQLADRLVPRQSVFAEDGRIIAPRRDDGHFYLRMELNGVPVDFVVDTGATTIVLSLQDARRIGLDPDKLSYTGRASTANGEVRTARVRIGDVRIGEFFEDEITAWVNEGELETSLLGMDYLQRYGRIQIEGDRLVLER